MKSLYFPSLVLLGYWALTGYSACLSGTYLRTRMNNNENFHRSQNFRQLSNLFSQIWLKKQKASLLSGIWREIRKKIIKNSQKMQHSMKKMKTIGNSIIQSRRSVGDFKLKFWDRRTVQRSALCRSRGELSNEYLLAKIGVDTAENEPLEAWGKIQFIIHSPP